MTERGKVMLARWYDRLNFKIIGYIAVGTLVLLASIFLNPVNHYANALLLMISAAVLYFYIVFAVADRNWLDIRAMFTAVWHATIGLTALRLLSYQEEWQNEAWVLCAVGYLMFQIGTNCGLLFGERKMPKLAEKTRKFGRISFKTAPNRMFTVCVVTTLIGLACFIANVLIKGFIPCFENDMFAYVDFYTKFHVFSTASTAACGLCYYCIKTQKIKIWQKAVLWVCIFYLLFLFPVLVVSRGIFVVAALSFTTVVFYLNKRKFTVLVLCIVVILGVYMLTSNLRSLSDDDLNDIFQPSDITTTETQVDENGEITQNEEVVFRLSPKLSFLYGYLTVSHDNINEAVKHKDETVYTWGTRQLQPINVILRIPAVNEIYEKGSYHQVTPNFNTTNMLGIFYYDFKEIGVVVFMFLWSFLFGLVQAAHKALKGPFSLMALGYVLAPVTLSFFSAWVDSFDLWMFCGTVLIFAIACSVHIEKKAPEQTAVR